LDGSAVKAESFDPRSPDQRTPLTGWLDTSRNGVKVIVLESAQAKQAIDAMINHTGSPPTETSAPPARTINSHNSVTASHTAYANSHTHGTSTVMGRAGSTQPPGTDAYCFALVDNNLGCVAWVPYLMINAETSSRPTYTLKLTDPVPAAPGPSN
jgi:hypothetical protein